MGISTRREAIVESLYEGTLDADAWRGALASIAQSVGGSGTLLLTYCLKTGRLVRDETVGVDLSGVSEYRKCWAEKDIRVPAGGRMPLLEPATEETILPGKAWERSEIFSDFLRHTDIGFMIGTWLQKDSSQVTSVSIQATGDHGPFDDEAVEFVRPIMPHVRRALLIRERIERQELRAEAIRGAFDQTAFGVMILDENGQILDASAAAVTALTATRSLERRSHGALAFGPSLQRAIAGLLATFTTNASLHDGVLRVTRPDGGPPVCMTVAPLPQARTVWLSAAPRWVVLVTDPERNLQASVPRIMCQLGISEREAEITAALCSGDRVGDVASRFRITENTVRAHLKAIFMKTGLHSQTELVRHVVTGPAWARSLNG